MHEIKVVRTHRPTQCMLLRLRSRSRDLIGKVLFTAGCRRFYVNIVSTRIN